MRFSFSWLCDHLDVSADVDLLDRLTNIGFEVEDVAKSQLYGFIVAEIVDAVQHPNADKLKLCKVNNGREILDIVCGADNARAGIKVILAPVGIEMPGGDVIKKVKIRGVTSNGMLCSERELGLGDDHDGIIELSDDRVVGETFQSQDQIIDLSVTPNRGDALSIRGIARDLCATGIGCLRRLDIPEVSSDFTSPININVESQYCMIYYGRYFTGVKNGQSPDWIQERLISAGMRPISTLVDITNYVLLEYGQPTHIYDADAIVGDICVRDVKNQVFVALNNNRYDLDDITVIADDKVVHGIAGIIGGQVSECKASSSNVFLEAAYFDPVRIALSGRKLGVITDARYRFERGVDPDFIPDIIGIITAMIVDLCGGKASDIVSFRREIQDIVIDFDPNLIYKVVGVRVDNNLISKILGDLGFEVDNSRDIWRVKSPSWRHDIQYPIDLVEEVMRIYGYGNIKPQPLPHDYDIERKRDVAWNCKLMLTMRGFSEVITWSFMSAKDAVLFGMENDELTIINQANLDIMRPSMLPNLLSIVSINAARNEFDLAVFEMGSVYGQNSIDNIMSGVRSDQYSAKNIYKTERDCDVFDIKADVFAVLQLYNVNCDSVSMSTKNIPVYYHPGQSAALCFGNNIIGYFGAIHPMILAEYEVSNVVAFEIYLDKMPVKKRKKKELKLSQYQKVSRDYAFLVDDDINPYDIICRIKQIKIVKSVKLFDIYHGVEEGKKSFAFNVIFQPDDHTMNDEELNKISNDIIELIYKNFGGIIR